MGNLQIGYQGSPYSGDLILDAMLSKLRSISFVVAAMGAISSASATFLPVDLADIPVKRLIANLKDRAEEEPKNAKILEHLARVHAMAYCKDYTDDVNVKIQPDADGLWFGFQPRHVPYAPYNVSLPDQKKLSDRARAHLKSAITYYDRSLALDPKDRDIALLGRAWCLEQAGELEKALAGYRRVIKQAWERDRKLKASGAQIPLTLEAIDYLRAHLDVKKDADEIADLEKKAKPLRKLGRWITPLVVPLHESATLETIIDEEARVSFDLDETKRLREWQWIDPTEAAWLVHDPRQTGEVSSGIQLFGSRSFMLFFENGYHALATLDDDGDGSVAGRELRGLALWQDRNGNGVSDAGEVRPLTDHGVVSLSCQFSRTDHGMFESRQGVRFQDGSVRATYDVILQCVPNPKLK